MKICTLSLSLLIILALLSVNAAPSDLPTSPKVTAKLERWISAHSDAETVKAWIYFRDKGTTDPVELEALLKERKKELSPRALWRRSKVRTDELVDVRDLAVHQDYKDRVLALCTRHRTDSRVLNAVSVETRIADIDRIATFDFVTRLDLVAAHAREDVRFTDEIPLTPSGGGNRGLNYGNSWTQLDQINVPAVHDLGFNGDGVIVCMMDTGFYKDHEAFAGLHVIDEWDFINNDGETQNEAGDDPNQHNHGTYTWSALGGMKDGKLYGPAYGASFLLAKTEDITQEVPIEEDWWQAGIEWAEGKGADMASSSLIYYDWYTFKDMDGKTCVTTIAANWATAQGVVVVNAMGNRGQYPGAIGAPADSDGVVSCGAVDSNGNLASFSSSGPTYDGRIKPNICAMGISTYCASPGSPTSYGTASGTSLSTPLVGGAVALLLQAHPDWTPADVRDAIQQTGSQSSAPNNNYGWGVMDTLGALYCTGYSLLDVDAFNLTGGSGGQVNFLLNGGAANANRDYLLAGSISGTEPGTLLPGGLATIPLNRDWITNYILARLNTPAFTDFQGKLDGAGSAAAQLNAPPVPGMIGTDLYFAYTVGMPWNFVSNPVTISIVP